jgi:hypothetical protein
LAPQVSSTWPSHSTWSCSGEQPGTQPVSLLLLLLVSSPVSVLVLVLVLVLVNSLSVLARVVVSVPGSTGCVLLSVSGMAVEVRTPVELGSSLVGMPVVVMSTSLAPLLETSVSVTGPPAG